MPDSPEHHLVSLIGESPDKVLLMVLQEYSLPPHLLLDQPAYLQIRIIAVCRLRHFAPHYYGWLKSLVDQINAHRTFRAQF